jgi:hypothetical protein
MSRFINKKTILTLLSIAFVFLFIPKYAHAGIFDITGGILDFVTVGFRTIMEIIVLPIAAAVFSLTGQILDAAIQFSLHTAYIFSLSPAINLGWTIVRDIANIIFIFVLIYISLGTIIKGTAGFKTKDLLTKVIIAAILINFSLFFTKVVIDVSNIFGNWMYGGIVNTLDANKKGTKSPTITDLINARMGIIQFWTGGSNATSNQTAKNVYTNAENSYVGQFIRLAVVLIATYIFAYCAIMFFARAITLLFLMVFSPIGFLGGVLPQLKKYSGQWRDELTSAAVFPVAFLLLLYISLQFINSLQKLTVNFGDSKIAIYFQYFMIIFLLNATLKLAKENSGEMGKALGGLADGLAKTLVNTGISVGAGGVGLLARSGMAAAFAEKGKGGSTFKETLRSGIPIWKETGNWREKSKDMLKKGSWDLRNAKIPGIGKENFGSVLSTVTGVDVKARTAKEINDEKKEFDEGLKTEKLEVKLLGEIKDIEKAKADISNGNMSDETRDAIIKQANDKLAKGEINDIEHGQRIANAKARNLASAHTLIDETESSMRGSIDTISNKQLEKLTKGIRNNSTFISHLKANHVDHLTDKSELNDSEKSKIKGIRIKPLKDAIAGGNVSDVKTELDKLGTSEVSDLGAKTLSQPLVATNLSAAILREVLRDRSVTAGERLKIRDAIANTGVVANPNGSILEKAAHWLEDDREGKTF